MDAQRRSREVARRDPKRRSLEETWERNAATGDPTPGATTTSAQRKFCRRCGETLQEHLTWQLEMSRLSERDMRIGAAIIDAINDDGYVIESLEEIARRHCCPK